MVHAPPAFIAALVKNAKICKQLKSSNRRIGKEHAVSTLRRVQRKKNELGSQAKKRKFIKGN